MLGPAVQRSFVGLIAWVLVAVAILTATNITAVKAEAQQPVVVQGSDGSRFPLAQNQPGAAQLQRAKQRAEAMRREAQNKQNANNAKDEKNSDGKKPSSKGGDNKPSESKTDAVTRPDKPPKVPDPRELEIEPMNGRVTFGFHGQPWPDVLQWLANASKMSLDWQELPSGYLNLTTQRSYTLAEARDLINRHLQARGYVMLLSGEVMSVTKIEKLDPSLAPRITEDELYDRQPHDFVKLTFQLPDGMDVKEASEDVKQVLSEHAKRYPLAATKRLLVIDSVQNLRLVSALLNEERLEREGREVPRRFPLKHARAEQVIDTLYVVLGIERGAKPIVMNAKQMQQMQRQRQQAQQQGKKPPKMPGKDEPKVHLAANRHDNSILANAPPPQLKIIARTIGMLDIPPPGMGRDASSEPGARFAKTYELQSIEPDSLIGSLEEIGNLSPLTDLRGDRKSKVLFARASQADHQRIEEIIKQLDGPKQRVEMYQLRRHPADEVAGTLMALVGGAKEKDDNSNRRRRSYYYFGYGYNDDQEEDEQIDLRVEADIENNRIFVRGNESLIKEVEAFLVQIGELPGSAGARYAERPVRVFEPIDRAATDRLLEQLRASWPSLGGGELRIDDGRPAPGPSTDQADKDNQPQTTETDPTADESRRTTRSGRRKPFRFASDGADPSISDPSISEPAAGPGASVTVTEDGRLVITSSDPEMLLRLEELVEKLRPAEKSFHEFPLQHVAAWYVFGKLEDFYEDILNAGVEERYTDWGAYAGKTRKDLPNRLSRRRRLRMVYNSVTNSIVVTNASGAQLQEIEKLIKVWDQPPMIPTEEAMLQRRTGMVKVRYSRATTIAAALKDVYRDLLSKRDKEFDTEEDKGGGFSAEKLTLIEYSGAESPRAGATQTRRTKPIETTFDGTLSIGVDEIANMIVISADAELYNSVVEMIQQLDEEARPKTTVQVLRVDVPAESLRSALGDALGKPWPGGKPESATSKNQQRNNNQRQRQQQQRRRQRGRGR